LRGFEFAAEFSRMHNRLAKWATDDVFVEPTEWFGDFLFAARTGNGERFVAKWVFHTPTVASKNQ
jgi:hypothetical protein